MRDLDIVLLGGAVGLLGVALIKGLAFNGNAGIDPTTGGVTLPAGTSYGPPAPDVTATGTIVEGLA